MEKSMEFKVAGVQVRDNEHLEAEYKNKMVSEFAKLFDQVWIKRPVGDVNYEISISADDTNDAVHEKIYNKSKEVARSALQAVTPDAPIVERTPKKK